MSPLQTAFRTVVQGPRLHCGVIPGASDPAAPTRGWRATESLEDHRQVFAGLNITHHSCLHSWPGTEPVWTCIDTRAATSQPWLCTSEGKAGWSVAGVSAAPAHILQHNKWASKDCFRGSQSPITHALQGATNLPSNLTAGFYFILRVKQLRR